MYLVNVLEKWLLPENPAASAISRMLLPVWVSRYYPMRTR